MPSITLLLDVLPLYQLPFLTQDELVQELVL